MIIFKVFKNNINFRLKSANVSLSITPALMPGLLDDLIQEL